MKNEKNKNEPKTKKRRIKFPIRNKLAIIFAFLIIFALGGTVAVIYKLFASDERVNAKANTFAINDSNSKSIQTELQTLQGITNSFMNFLYLIKDDTFYEIESKLFFEDLCNTNPDILFVSSPDSGFFATDEFLAEIPNAKDLYDVWSKKTIDSSKLAENTEIKNLSEIFSRNNTLGIIFDYNGKPVCVGFDSENLAEACSGTTNTTFVINKHGEPLIYEDNETYISTGVVPDLSIAKEIMQINSSSEYVYKDKSNRNWIYISSTILEQTCFIITITSETSVMRNINLTALRIIAISLAVFFLAILIIRFFSLSISNPISKLVSATQSIDEGNYDIELKAKSHDEIGYLTESFMEMTGGLKERQRLMDSFSKFTNKVIAEKATKGELVLGGEHKEATVFFSDIRSFTEMSEAMSPEEVVSFLNDYFTRMVDCVNKTNGIVDKFIGDAVMAVWGAATTNGSPEADAWAAVKAALMMRIALYHFNQNQIKKGKKPIKIGCGINSGPIVAGQIGSEDHINYTVIGDTVNLASRTEALNKPFATDILITENTYKLIKNKVIVEKMKPVSVKGKAEPIQMYAVVNAVGISGPADIHKLREFLGWKEPDLAAVNVNEEEKKYKLN